MSTYGQSVAIDPAVHRFMRRTHKLLIGGEWVPAASGATFETHDPATGDVLTTCASGDATDIDRAVQAARQAFPAWAATPPIERERLLHRFADLLELRRLELAQLEVLDNGKPFALAYQMEVDLAVDQMHYCAGMPTRITGETYPVSNTGFAAYTRREPLGVCGAITPWNYSLIMAVQKIGPVLACGNTLVLKPAEQTPLTALRVGELALEAGIPAGVLNIVTGYGPTAGAALAQHRAVDAISFTGSTEVGRQIVQASAGNLKQVSLELGGKSPLIIMDDANLDDATETAVWAIFANSGQNCVAGSRLYIQRSVYQQMIDQLVARAESLRVGPGMQHGVDLGPLISQTQRDRVCNYIEQGLAQHATLLTGGTDRPHGCAGGYFVPPTIFADVPDDATIAREEIFGPVLSVFVFDTEAEVLTRANALPYGLAAGVFTENVGRAQRMSAALHAGTVWVNTYDWFDPAVPFGGMGQSGYGRELGHQAADLYTTLKTVWVKS
ncbi:MAG: aldehyde dehydrogenase family protein [Chloroflexaceae bacterium]|nr:aldehyde dehydrogenase family protein [Chloroflexaceae bacterium]